MSCEVWAFVCDKFLYLGTNTGKAFSHLSDISFLSQNNRPDAPDYVILITNEKSEDDVEEPVRLVKETGAKVSDVSTQQS